MIQDIRSTFKKKTPLKRLQWRPWSVCSPSKSSLEVNPPAPVDRSFCHPVKGVNHQDDDDWVILERNPFEQEEDGDCIVLDKTDLPAEEYRRIDANSFGEHYFVADVEAQLEVHPENPKGEQEEVWVVAARGKIAGGVLGLRAFKASVCTLPVRRKSP